jgi:hypothetical protein
MSCSSRLEVIKRDLVCLRFAASPFLCCVCRRWFPLRSARSSIEFNRDIRPILNDACFACHGPDSASRKGELRLDQRDAAVEKSAIVEGKPEESEMIRRILSDNPEEIMPPPELKKTLSPEQKKLLVGLDQIRRKVSAALVVYRPCPARGSRCAGIT